MSTPAKVRKNPGKVDAWAIVFLVILVVAAAVFWSNHT